VAGAALVATNVFALARGVWKMVHHHASPVAQEAFVVVPSQQEDDASLN